MSTAKQLLYLLTVSQRRAAWILLGSMLVGMVLETLGIGLILPAIAMTTQGDALSKYSAFVPVLRTVGADTPERLVIAVMLILVGVNLVKVVFLGLLGRQQAVFVYELQADLSHRLFAGYLRQPYTFHLQRNSAQLIRNVVGQVGDLTSVMQQSLVLITEVLVMIGLAAMLFIVQPLGALCVGGILGLAVLSFHRATAGYIPRWGVTRQAHEQLRIQHLQQGLGAAKDVKLLGREENFIDEYKLHNTGSARVGQYQLTLQALPRLWMELLMVIGLAVLVFVMMGQKTPISELPVTLGLFAAAAFRLMPSVNRAIFAVQSSRFFGSVVDTLYNEFRLIEANPAPSRGGPLPFVKALALLNISFRYPATDVFALSDVSLTIPHGTSVGIIGGSGAGKSTLVDVILGLLTPEKGAVLVDGVDTHTNLRRWQDQIGYVPQAIYLTDDTLRRNVAFGLANERIDDAAVLRAIHAAQLDEFVRESPKGIEMIVGERGIRLSGGQRQRIGIARALYHDPPVLVLDEATSSLDTLTERSVIDAVRALQGEKTVLIVAHRHSTVEHCDRIFRLDRGKLVEEASAVEMLRAHGRLELQHPAP